MYIGNLPSGSNRGAYGQDFQLFDDETDEGLDLTDATIVVEIRKPGTTTTILSATNGSGVTITDSDEGQWSLDWTSTQMRTLDALQYECGITLTINGETVQYLIGTLPVLDGIVA